jgi:hypothetical protein
MGTDGDTVIQLAYASDIVTPSSPHPLTARWSGCGACQRSPRSYPPFLSTIRRTGRLAPGMPVSSSTNPT